MSVLVRVQYTEIRGIVPVLSNQRVQSNVGVRVGRHKACPYRGHGGRLRGTTRVGDRWHRQYAGDAAPTWHGVWGALRGESPRTRKGRRPDRTELQ